ncbi:MAG TPA: MFS transporter [Candidatus Binataceae bacterium]|nr:MFS transporter [Candidatus Binataceae bacterium]
MESASTSEPLVVGTPAATGPALAPISAILLLAWSHFLLDGTSTFLPGVLPAVLTQLQIPLRLVGVVMASLLVGQALQPCFGWFADKLGGRAFILCGVGGSALGGALIGWVPGYWSLAGALLMVGLSGAMFHPQALASVRVLPVQRTGLCMSTFLLGGQLGQAIWPLLASLVVVGRGLHWLPLLSLPAFLSLPFLAPRLPHLPRHPDRSRRVIWRGRRLALATLVAYVGLESGVQYSLVTFLPILWVRRGGSLVGGASLITVILFAGVAGNIVGGHLSDHIGRRPIMVLSGAMAASCLALLLLFPGPLMWLLLAGIGMALISSNPAQILVGQDLLPENRSIGSGFAMGFSNAMGALLMVGLGYLAAYSSIFAVLWLDVFLCTAAALTPFLLPASALGLRPAPELTPA